MSKQKVTSIRRHVILSNLHRRGGRPRLWAYGYADLGLLLGLTEHAVKMRVKRGAFDPSSLASVIEYANKLAAKAARRDAKKCNRKPA